MYHRAQIGGMNREGFNAFFDGSWSTARQDEQTLLIFDNAPAHRHADNPAWREHGDQNVIPPYSPFLNIVVQAICALKAAIKADISRPVIQQRIRAGPSRATTGPGSQFACGPPPIFLVSIGYL